MIKRSVFAMLIFCLTCGNLPAQGLVFANRLIEYKPAPGQYINDPAAGTSHSAEALINKIGDPVSLGAYGGYIIFGFERSIENDPDNPYGADFIIYGNATATHSEPGIVMVSSDLNKNGLPDDPWYEIAGSEHFCDGFTKDYSITYYNPGNPSASDVPWSDSNGNSGMVFMNSFHSQPYYPESGLFPGISQISLCFSGSKIQGNVLFSQGIYQSLPAAFGYADNTPVNSRNLYGIPDNPYTPQFIEGDGGDAIDISWAVDGQGRYADLKSIDFIKVYTGINACAGWLGEISTEIRGIADVAPDKSIQGTLKMIQIPVKKSNILVSDTLYLSSKVFISGRPCESEEIRWISLNSGIIEIRDNLAIPVNPGSSLLRVQLVSDPGIMAEMEVNVVNPSSIRFDSDVLSLSVGETREFTFEIRDDQGTRIEGIIPEVSSPDGNIIEINDVKDNRIIIKALEAGNTSISFSIPGSNLDKKNINVQVIPATDQVRVIFSMSDDQVSILPAREYSVARENLMNYTDRYERDVFTSKPYICLADVIVSVLTKEGFGTGAKSFAFRQDEYGGDGLYLWQVGYDWEYKYGWGGSKKSSTYANTWFAIINEEVFATGFDTIRISNGDRVSLHHVADNGASWNYIRVIPGKTEIGPGEQVELHAEQLDIYPSRENEFSVSGPFPVINARVNIDNALLDLSASELITSYTGDFILCFKVPGEHMVEVEQSDPVLLRVSFPLTSAEVEGGMTVFPVPSPGWLKIQADFKYPPVIKIYNIDGRLVYLRDHLSETNDIELNISFLSPGAYFLEAVSQEKSIRKKIYRQ